MHETIPEARVEGQVQFGDFDAYNGTSPTQLRRRVGMVFQKPNPFPTMNQNDAWAPVIATLFTGANKQPPFQADTSNRDNGLIYTVNAKTAPGAKESAGMDFTRPDAARASVLNGILWQASKGSVPRPISRHGYSGVH